MRDKDFFQKAIENLSGDALLISDNGDRIPFKANIQPVLPQGGGSHRQLSRIGAGERKTCRLYTPRTAISAVIKEGDSIMYQGCVYIVERIEDMGLYGEIYFREGLLRKSSPCSYEEG